MRDRYLERRDRPITTMDLEQHLVCRSGRSELVDAFHRFVYGFDDPSPAPDLWIKDDPAHTGTEGWGGPFWDSPDLWIRNDDDGGTTHQPVEHGQDNWFHARVRNRGQTVARHFLVTFNVLAFAGVGFRFPDDFLPAVTAAAGFDLAPGASTVGAAVEGPSADEVAIPVGGGLRDQDGQLDCGGGPPTGDALAFREAGR